MPLKKISTSDDVYRSTCLHPEHNAPTMIVLESGTYEYTCPGCGEKTIFTVPGIRMLK